MWLLTKHIFAAGNFPTESDLWNFWPTGVTPVGRDIATEFIGDAYWCLQHSLQVLAPTIRQSRSCHFTVPLHNISGQSTYWDLLLVLSVLTTIQVTNTGKQTTWTIAAPSTTATTSRAVGYIGTAVSSNVSAQAPWSGDHRLSGWSSGLYE